MANSDVTNLTELAYCFGVEKRNAIQKVTGVGSLLPGETYEQAVQRRAETARRIEEKMAAKRAAKTK